MKVDTPLREYVYTEILEIAPVDVVIGIPTCQFEETLAHVVRAVAERNARDYPEAKTIILVFDGGALDDTREAVRKLKLPPRVLKILFIYGGLPGKGTSRWVMVETAVRMRAKVCAAFDGDLRSITPEWVKAMADPVPSRGFDFVSASSVRHKDDGTITHNIASFLTRVLDGGRVRQPIAGGFSSLSRLMEFFSK